jgi:hypothetical protein
VDRALVATFIQASRAQRDAALGREAELLANRIIDDFAKDPERAMLVATAAIRAYGPRPRLNLALSYAVFAPGKRLQRELQATVRQVALAADARLMAVVTDDLHLMMLSDQEKAPLWDRELEPANTTAERWLPIFLEFARGGRCIAAIQSRIASAGAVYERIRARLCKHLWPQPWSRRCASSQ